MFRTGIPSLDILLGGGIPMGLCEISGEDTSGRSTLALSVMKEANLDSKQSLLIHSDGFPDPTYCRRAGPKDFLVSVPTWGEEALELAFRGLSGGIHVVVIDSIPNLVPVELRYHKHGERNHTSTTRFLYHGLYHLSEEAKRRGCVVIVVNQSRDVLKTKAQCSAYEPVVRRLCNTRIKTARIKTVNKYGSLDHTIIRFQLLGRAGRTIGATTGRLFNQKGFDRNFGLLELLLSSSILTTRRGFVYDEGRKIGHGYSKTAKAVKENYDTYYGRLIEYFNQSDR